MTNRYKTGLANLHHIDGETGEKVLTSLADIYPDLRRYIIEYPFGDIYGRPHLTLQQRELITIAMLATLGHAAPQLAVHIHGALNVSCDPQEITETLLQTSV